MDYKFKDNNGKKDLWIRVQWEDNGSNEWLESGQLIDSVFRDEHIKILDYLQRSEPDDRKLKEAIKDVRSKNVEEGPEVY